MNEIWAESGVLVVSKNLDVLVSKLRKKLIHDDKIKISNVHGVGYKLEIG
jgi:DNA-binding response OmpR family regulator